MLIHENIPIGFKILCLEPNLRIRHSAQFNCCLMLFFMPFIILFIGHISFVFLMLYEVINIGIVRVIEHIGQRVLEYWYFPFILSILGFATFHALWINFGITDFLANDNSLIVIKRLFCLSKTQEISKNNIKSFQQVKDGGEGMDSFPSWALEVVTNQRIYDERISLSSRLPENIINQIAHRKILLIDRQDIEKSDCLGSVLANFYNVEFQQSEKRQ